MSLSQEQAKDYIEELLQVEGGLSAWEIDFIEAMENREADYTPNMLEKIEQVWSKHCGGKCTHN